MLLETVRPFVPSEFLVKFADQAWEIRAAARLRRQVFCVEQRLFDGDDRDAIDDTALPIVALSTLCGGPDEVVGTVRIHQPDPGIWWGTRLAVAADQRQAGPLGAALIRLAVGGARGRGCHRFLAHVQERNVPLFRRLHWQTLEVVTLHGRPHHFMAADLAHYPVIAPAAAGFTVAPRRAA